MIRLYWAGQLHGSGNTYGYSSMANKMKAELVKRSDVEIIDDLNQEYDIAVHMITPESFKPIPYAKNLLVTMYEATDLPDSWIKPINDAEVLVVPCRQNVDLFSRYYKRGKVERCRLGIDPVMFPFYQRKLPVGKLVMNLKSGQQEWEGEPFRVLWLGAPNPRKGFQLAIATWTLWLNTGRMPKNVQLYMKSSGTEKERVVKFKAAVNLNHEKPKNPSELAALLANGKAKLDFFEEKDCSPEAPELPGIVFDTRNYTAEQMTELYHSAHAFILPSVGEGWGLTLCEAMATGCPSIWTHWSGPKDFADESTGFPVTKYTMGKLQMMTAVRNDDGQMAAAVSHISYGAIAHGDAILRRLEQIYADYPAALKRGKKASERVHAHFKWSDCVEEFVEICKRRA